MKRQKKHSAYHTHAEPGKRIRIRLTDGTVFVDRLTQYPSGNMYEFAEHGKIKASRVEKVELYSKSFEIKTALIRINRTGAKGQHH